MTFAPAFPVQCGTFRTYSAAQLAERVIEAIANARKRDKAGQMMRYAVCIDIAGRVAIDRLAEHVPDHVATATAASDPDWLADELAHEWDSRNRVSASRRTHPVLERVEATGGTAKEIAAALGLKVASVAALLSDAYDRGQIDRDRIPQRLGRPEYRYRTRTTA